jgi:tetratricopeptide (TPR) repeat protein
MRAINGVLVLAAFFLCAPANAEEYWSFSYQGIQVTAAGNAGRAADLGHDLVQLDAAFAKTSAASTTSWRAPAVHVYALPGALFKKVWGADVAAGYLNAGSYQDILINSDHSNADDPHWAAYSAYIAALLSREGMRYPSWLSTGISSVFASSSISGDRVTIGGFDRGQIQLLARSRLIPMRTLLSLKGNDPQLHDRDFLQLYWAQCWLFVHQILIEHKYAASVDKYVDLLRQGKTENEAFAASFSVSYDDLDAFMRGLMTKGTINRFAINFPKLDAAAPQSVSVAEVDARLAEFGVRHNREVQEAMQLAQSALSVEPNNERAWRALARSQIIEGNYAEALASVEKLVARPSLSAAGHADCGFVLALIAQHHADAATDTAALWQRARSEYEQAIALNYDDVASLYELAGMIETQKDVEAAKKFQPAMEQAFYRNPRNSELAKSLVHLCLVSGDLSDAFKFTVAWQENAKSDADEEQATTYASHIKASIERHSAAGLNQQN